MAVEVLYKQEDQAAYDIEVVLTVVNVQYCRPVANNGISHALNISALWSQASYRYSKSVKLLLLKFAIV